MKILFQPEKSRTCGAHCVAMVTGVPVDKVLELIGHKRGTRYKEIANVFKALGYPNASRRPRRFAYQKQLPDVCLIALHWKRGGAHWVVYNHGYIFCPGKGVYEYNLKNLAEQHVIAKFYMLVGDKVEQNANNTEG